MFKEYGCAVKQSVGELPPRNDVVEFEFQTDSMELERNLKLIGCPTELQPQIREVVMEYWDVFCEQGLRRPIHGFSFQIDTGDAKLVCCKHHWYGPHELKVIDKLVDKLQENGLIEDDDGPWGAIIVLAAKPHQEEVPWDKYKWRLCVSYR